MVATKEQTSFPDKVPKRTEILYPFSVDPILREHVSRDGMGMGTSQGIGPVKKNWVSFWGHSVRQPPGLLRGRPQLLLSPLEKGNCPSCTLFVVVPCTYVSAGECSTETPGMRYALGG